MKQQKGLAEIKMRKDENQAISDNFKRRLDAADTIEKLDELRVELVAEKQKIEMQLGDKDKRDADGNRMREREYHAWRSKAIYAKISIERELMQVKTKLKHGNRAFNTDAPVKYERVEDLLHASLVLIGKLAAAFELTDEEQKQVDELKRGIDSYLRSKAPVRTAS